MQKTLSSHSTDITSAILFDTLFDNAMQNCMLLMDEHGTIVKINKAFSNAFGYEPKDIIGRNSEILFTDEDKEKGLPQKELNAVLSKGQGSDNNYLVSKDKTSTWVMGESVLAKGDDGKPKKTRYSS